jgi:hypothetical protein
LRYSRENGLETRFQKLNTHRSGAIPDTSRALGGSRLQLVTRGSVRGRVNLDGSPGKYLNVEKILKKDSYIRAEVRMR